uniref:Uncharacterized protein n=1 Tax=Timema douglasi TaxID=61478 RepID=A0A7R8W035_TIMDO|nr:unnamed protein product [Timema douglasi]
MCLTFQNSRRVRAPTRARRKRGAVLAAAAMGAASPRRRNSRAETAGSSS